MIRILLLLAAALPACTPSPKESTMRSPSPAPGTRSSGGPEAGRDAGATQANKGGADAPAAPGRSAGDQNRAAQGPIPEPVSAAEDPGPARPVDSPAEAGGRRTLSTAFVRVGPDGQLTVVLRDERVLVLRDVVMGPRDYCGVQVGGSASGRRFCGNYADVAAARPGGAPAPQAPDLAVSNSTGRPATGD